MLLVFSLLLPFNLSLPFSSLSLSPLTEVHEDGAGHVATTRGLVEVAAWVVFLCRVFFRLGVGKKVSMKRKRGRRRRRRRKKKKRKKKGFAAAFSLSRLRFSSSQQNVHVDALELEVGVSDVRACGAFSGRRERGVVSERRNEKRVDARIVVHSREKSDEEQRERKKKTPAASKGSRRRALVSASQCPFSPTRARRGPELAFRGVMRRECRGRACRFRRFMRSTSSSFFRFSSADESDEDGERRE